MKAKEFWLSVLLCLLVFAIACELCFSVLWPIIKLCITIGRL